MCTWMAPLKNRCPISFRGDHLGLRGRLRLVRRGGRPSLGGEAAPAEVQHLVWLGAAPASSVDFCWEVSVALFGKNQQCLILKNAMYFNVIYGELQLIHPLTMSDFP